MNFEESLNFVFAEVTNRFWSELEASMNKIGLHGGQIFVLISLWNEDEQTQIELAGNLRLSPPTINRMIKSLANNGFVKTRRSKTDARKVRVSLTEKGELIRSEVEVQWQKLENEFFAVLNETEKLILRQIFGKLKTEIVLSSETTIVK